MPYRDSKTKLLCAFWMDAANIIRDTTLCKFKLEVGMVLGNNRQMDSV